MFNLLNPKTWLTEKSSSTESKDSGSAIFGKNLQFSNPNVAEKLQTYKSNDWVFGAVDIRAEVFADIEIKLFRRNRDGEKVEIFNHVALDMLKRPNAHITTFELLEVTSIHLDLAGQAFWLVDREAKQIWWLPPQKVTIIPDPVKFIKGYKYKVGNQEIEYAAEDIVHFRKPDPSDLYGSTSALDATARTFNLDQAATEWNWKFFKQGGAAQVLLYFKKKFAKGVFKQFVNKYRDNYEGVENAHKTQFLEHEVDKVDLDRSQRDMQFSELQDKTRDRILGGGFRVSKALLGLDENSNRSTIDGAQYGFRAFVNRPRLKRAFAKINLDFLFLFDGGKYFGQEMFFEFEDLTPQDEELKLKKRDSDLDRGVISINEARERQGLEPAEGGEVARIDGSKIRIDEDSTLAQDKTPAKDEKKNVLVTERKGFKKPLKSRVKSAYLKRFKGNELDLSKTIKDYFAEYEKEVLERLKRNADRLKKGVQIKALGEDIVGSAKAEKVKIFKKIFPTILLIAEKEGQAAIAELGLADSFNIAKIRTSLTSQTQTFATKIADSSFDFLQNEIKLGIANGETELEIGNRIKKVFTNAKTYRAKTIARTQTNNASNMAHKAAYDELGIVKREWVSAHDTRTRKGHEDADGQTVLKDEAFSVRNPKGDIEFLDFPSDSAHGSAANTINCRCRTVAAFDD